MGWDTASAVDARARLGTLQDLIGTELGEELHRHVIVSAIAALQTAHRGTIVQVVDHSETFRERAAESITEKFSLQEALGWVSGKKCTFGELVAHAAPCNSVTDLISWLTKILGFDLKAALATAVYPYERNDADAATIVGNVEELIADVGEAFRLRHIFAHEAAPSVDVDADTCSRLLTAVRRWVIAIDGVLWVTLFKDQPLSTLEMRRQAQDRVMAARKALAAEMRTALKIERGKGSAAWLRANHRDWDRFTRNWTNNSYKQLDGTMWPAVAADDLANAISARAKQVGDWVRCHDLDDQPASADIDGARSLPRVVD